MHHTSIRPDDAPPGREWAAVLRAAMAAKASAEAAEQQAVRDALTIAGVTPGTVAAVLGIKGGWRITRITETLPPEPVQPPLPTVVYLHGLTGPDETWAQRERLHRAMQARGWYTVTDRKAAWHLQSGGARVVAVDCTALAVGGRDDEPPSVTLVQAVPNPTARRNDHLLVPLVDQPDLRRSRPPIIGDTSTVDVDAVAMLVGELLGRTA